MARMISLVPIGALAGCGAVLLTSAMRGPEERAAATAIGIVEPASDPALPAEPVPAPGAFAANRAAHEDVAATTNALDLESMIERVAAEPRSIQRDTRLEAMLAQLATLDPAGAMRFVQRLDLGDRALARVFQVWADSNPEEALAEMRSVWPPSAQRAVALALLEVFGANETGIEKIANAYPPADAMSFRIDAIGALARLDFDAATAAADKIPISATQTIAQQRMAQIIAGIDPLRGLEYAARIPIPIQRQRFMDALLDNWAKLDPNGMFAYMETADLTQMAVSANSFRALATINPGQLLGLAEKFAPAQRVNAQRAALEALTALDPVSAYNRVSSLPASADRDNFINTVAQRYAAQSSEAALAWVTTLQPHNEIAFNAVMSAIAAQSPQRVADAVIAEIVNPATANRAGVPSLAAMLTTAMQAKSPDIATIADKLAGHSDPRVRVQLTQLLQRWPQADAEGALTWAMRNPANLTAESAPQFAQLLATQNPTLARQSVARLPTELRGPWIQGAASGMARSDFAGTLDWLQTFRSEPFFESALVSTLTAGATAEPEAVARQLDNVPAETRVRVASTVASAWAARDPKAAADWLTSFPPEERDRLGNAATTIASRWSQTDAAAAERWVLDLPRGNMRDLGVVGLLATSASSGTYDARLLNELSSAEARARAVMNAVPALGRSNPELARQLIDRHVTDPAQRTQADQVITSLSRLPAGRGGGGGLPANLILRSGSGTCIQVINGEAVQIPC